MVYKGYAGYYPREKMMLRRQVMHMNQPNLKKNWRLQAKRMRDAPMEVSAPPTTVAPISFSMSSERVCVGMMVVGDGGGCGGG